MLLLEIRFKLAQCWNREYKYIVMWQECTKTAGVAIHDSNKIVSSTNFTLHIKVVGIPKPKLGTKNSKAGKQKPELRQLALGLPGATTVPLWESGKG